MHIPDGFLTPPVWATLDIICVPAVSLLARKAKAEVDEFRIPLRGVMGAFVFAAQMTKPSYSRTAASSRSDPIY
jgi:cobalt/nickel transport system permease protein